MSCWDPHSQHAFPLLWRHSGFIRCWCLRTSQNTRHQEIWTLCNRSIFRQPWPSCKQGYRTDLQWARAPFILQLPYGDAPLPCQLQRRFAIQRERHLPSLHLDAQAGRRKLQEVLERKAAKIEATVEKTQREKQRHAVSRHVLNVVMATKSLFHDVMELDVSYHPPTTSRVGDVI